jgi:hypothetical protein
MVADFLGPGENVNLLENFILKKIGILELWNCEHAPEG